MGRPLRTIVPILLLLASASSAGAQAAAPIDSARKTDVTIPAADVTLAATLYVPGARPRESGALFRDC